MSIDPIWRSPQSLDAVNESVRHSMAGWLGIAFTKIGPDFISATMPVDHRTQQPFGLLHGGASVALAETVGSTASTFVIDPAREICVGQEINANHVRAARDGIVTATARPLHVGRRSHVWDIRITGTSARLVCVARLTMAVLPRR